MPPDAPRTDVPAHDRTLDAVEVDRFARRAGDWWDETGKFRALHQIAPARLKFLRDEMVRHFAPAPGARALEGLGVLDIGCGGGLVSEPLARLGARVTGIDPARENIEVARAHALAQGLAVDYRVGRLEDLVGERLSFDAVLCLEVLEHVPDPAAFLKAASGVLRPGGLMLLSTINRTLKAFVLAILGAEYVLGWLPVGTHRWERFLTPAEVGAHLAAAGLGPARIKGLVYSPLAQEWSLGADCDVNYLAASAKPG